MVKNNKNIMRGILLTSYVFLIAVIVYSVSAVFAYLNTGADRSKILHTEFIKPNYYTPKTTWASLDNKGRKMDDFTLKTIEKDYLNAWYVRHVAFKDNATTGVDDYFTVSARKNIYSLIEKNKQENISVEATTLKHNPKLEFFSEDGKIVSITDNDVLEYQRVYKGDTLIVETTTRSSYKTVMLLEDGFWRVRHIVKTETKPLKKEELNSDLNIKIKGINYYPQDTPWDMFGNKFNIRKIKKDFKIINRAGLNTIRIFLQYEDFGKAEVKPEKLKKLKQVLDTAEKTKLNVIVTLFDFYGDYSVLDWTLNQSHVEQIVNSIKDHKALIAWDIKNEPDLDFESRGRENVMAWLNYFSDLIKKLDPENAVTIGWSKAKSAMLLADKVDFVSFHYYEDIKDLELAYDKLITLMPNKNIVLGEFGVSSYNGVWDGYSKNKETQAEFHKYTQSVLEKNNIQFISWTLYDFKEIPTEVTGVLPWRRNPQKEYGFIDVNGKKKPAFKYISNTK